jgi:phospholipid/cholesterol/gamma-HCH transport system permease protein
VRRDIGRMTTPANAFSISATAPAATHPVVATIQRIGALVRRGIEKLGGGSRFVLEVGRSTREVSTWLPLITGHARSVGVESLPIGLFIAAFTGIVIALLASYSFTGAIPLYFVGTLVGKTLLLELAPVLTGLVLAGRVGASVAAELGTMRVTEQIDALETLTYDPLAYLVVPRVIAGMVLFPLIVAAAMIAGVASGWVTSIALLDLSAADFAKGLRLYFQVFDVEYGLVKAASFGLAVTLVGCSRGFRAQGGASGVGRAATSTVVLSAVWILVLDALWAVVWLLGHQGGT